LKDIEERLARLEARNEVLATIAQYSSLNDRYGAVEALLAMFREDAVLRNPSGAREGIDAISEYYRATAVQQDGFARHHVMNQVVTFPELDVARHEAYFLAILGRDGESRLAFGRYDDVLKRDDGGWKFATKVNDVTGVTTLEAGWAHGFPTAAG